MSAARSLSKTKPSTEPALRDLPAAKYLCVAGTGPPGGAAFQEALAALYATAYTVRFAAKREGREVPLGPLEAIWDRLGKASAPLDLAGARWRVVVQVPDGVRSADLAAAAKALQARGQAPKAAVRLVRIKEGRCVEALHVGPYGDEPRTVQRMAELASSQGYRLKGPHHEIYLSDPRRVAPGRLKTLLRQPVAAAA